MTLADEDTNLILTDYANRAIPCNMAIQVAPPNLQPMQVAPPCRQIWSQCKWRLLKSETRKWAKFCLISQEDILLLGKSYNSWMPGLVVWYEGLL